MYAHKGHSKSSKSYSERRAIAVHFKLRLRESTRWVVITLTSAYMMKMVDISRT